MVSGRHVKLLILTGYLHCPPISGGAMRMVSPILKLAETGCYDVTYLLQYRSDEEVQRAKSFFAPYPQVNLVSIRNQNQFHVSERDLQLEIPLEVFNAMDLVYYQALERLLETEQFDLVQVEHSWMSWAVPLIQKNRPDLPVILDLHNIEATLFQRWIQYGSDNEREEMAVRWEKTRRWEEETWQWFDACLAVSPLELQAYQAQTGYQIPAWELPSGGGIDLSRFPRTDSARRRKKETILSLGTLEWSANTHGLLWFIDEVMPLLKQTHPHACLCIAGFGTPDNKLMQHILGREDINFLGELKDERPMLSRSKVFIVPLWIGAGARVKILTAWAAGIPVVATTIGAEGLNYTDGENILIADEIGEFARKITRLMEDETLVVRLSHNGRDLVEERYSLEYAVKEYDQIYGSIVKGASLPTTNQHVDYDFEEKERTMRQLMQLKADMPVIIDVGKYESALSAIHQSLVWRMLARYDRVVNKLLPQGTKRRGAYNLYVSAFRIVVNEGWRSFFRKTKIWFRHTRENLSNSQAGKYSHDAEENLSREIISERFFNIFSLGGCYICGALCECPPPNDVTNLRETVLCHNCGAIKRHNDVARVLLEVMRSNAPCLSQVKSVLYDLEIYLLESYGPIYNVLSESHKFVCSEFLDDVPVGTTKDNIRCEDVQNLTFLDDSFDMVIAQDIFEHIADPRKGFKEVYRVLKPAGHFILTVPFNRSLKISRIRATVKDNKVHHILPPSYHGDKLRRDGVLVFTDFGLDLMAILEEVGFEVKSFEDEHPEYAGGHNIVFACKKH